LSAALEAPFELIGPPLDLFGGLSGRASGGVAGRKTGEGKEAQSKYGKKFPHDVLLFVEVGLPLKTYPVPQQMQWPQANRPGQGGQHCPEDICAGSPVPWKVGMMTRPVLLITWQKTMEFIWWLGV
jgi:hypothetical protein